MKRINVCNPTKAAIYIAECLLATVDDFCAKKNPPVGDFKRHISVAGRAIEFLELFHSYGDSVDGRVKTVFDEFEGSVEDYAKSVRNRWFPLDNERYFE
jgi:hypothetical protein